MVTNFSSMNIQTYLTQMKNRLIILLILISGFLNQSFSQSIIQCDSIKVYNGDFDNLFQNEFVSIEADTILAIRHCGTTNGCYNTYGLLCWKENGTYNFKLIRRDKKGIKTSTKIKRELQSHLVSFFDEQVFSKTGEVEIKQEYWMNDGPCTIMLFKSTGNCWRFGYGSMTSEDIRVVWAKRLVEIMRK